MGVKGCWNLSSQNHPGLPFLFASLSPQWHHSVCATPWDTELRPLQVLRHFKKRNTALCINSFPGEGVAKTRPGLGAAHGTARIGTAGVGTESPDPQGKCQERTWISASFGKMRNLLARRRKGQNTWESYGIRRNSEPGSEQWRRGTWWWFLNRAEIPKEFLVCQEMPSRPAQGTCPLEKIQSSFFKGWKGGRCWRGKGGERDERWSVASGRHRHTLKAFLPVTARDTLYLNTTENEKTLPLQACINELPSRPACQGHKEPLGMSQCSLALWPLQGNRKTENQEKNLLKREEKSRDWKRYIMQTPLCTTKRDSRVQGLEDPYPGREVWGKGAIRAN